jgi:hypothetical protein
MTAAEPPICPTCGQPATEGLVAPANTWECENEACPEFGQVVRVDETPAPAPASEPEA